MVGLRAQYEMMQDAKDLVERDPLSVGVRTALRPMVETALEELVHTEFDRINPQFFIAEREEKLFGSGLIED